MKLSMWMIANRLSELDMILNIREDAPVILNSARILYATNCVYIYEDGDNVICDGEGDQIIIPHMGAKEAFEIVQSVFDYFQDWTDLITKSIHQRDFQTTIELAWQVFQNPLLLFDSNSKCLGMTKNYPPEEMDAEWAYLLKYGYTSLNALQQMKYDASLANLTSAGLSVYGMPYGKNMNISGAIYNIYNKSLYCGHLNLLNKDRELNPGDFQLLEHLATMLEPVLGQAYYEENFASSNIIYDLLMGLPCDPTSLAHQLEYMQWKETDDYYLCRLHFPLESTPGRVEIAIRALDRQILNVTMIRLGEDYLILSTRDLSKDPQASAFLHNYQANNPVYICFSNPCRSITDVHFLVKQTQYMMDSCLAGKQEDVYCHFEEFASDYILECGDLSLAYHACMPQVLTLWEASKKGDEHYHTLEVWLACERSTSRTAAALYTHRNTVQYRLRKVQEMCDLDDPKTRAYCGLSVMVLNLYSRKYPKCK
jgi:hypothetical protein